MNDSQLRIIIESLWKGQGADAAQKSLANVDREAGKAQAGLQKFNAGLRLVESSMVAVAAAGAVFKTAFDMAEAGAQMQLARDQFGRLAESINSSSDEILAGLSEVTGGLLTQAQMIESANQIIGLGLAGTGQEVVDLAGLVANLGWDMQTVIMTFANDSTMRLDALGLSVEDVTARMKEFQAAGHSAGEAFDLAVIDAGKAKLELLGSAADSSAGAFGRLRAQVGDATNQFKEFLAGGLTPVVEYITGGYAEAIGGIGDAQLEAAQSSEQLVAVLERQRAAYEAAGGGGLFLTNMEKAVAQSVVATATALAQSSGSLEEFTAGLEKAGVSSEQLQHFVHAATGQIGQSATAFYAHQRAVLADAQELQRHMAITDQAGQAQERLGISLETTADRLAYAALAARDAGQASDDYEVSAEQVAEAEERRAEAHTTAAEATLAAAAATLALQQAMENIAAGAIQEQFQLIDQLSQAYADSAAGAEDAAGRILAATTSIAEGYKSMVLEMIMADAGGTFTQDAADFAVTVGLMTEAEAAARIEAERLVDEQRRLVELWQEGKITAEELGEATGLLADGFASGADAALRLSGAFGEAYGTGDGLRAMLEEIEGNYDITVTTTWQEVGEPPNIPAPGGYPGAPNAVSMAEGGWVAGGVPGRDSVAAWLMPGERVLSTDEVGRMGGPAVVDAWAGGTGTITNNGYSNTNVTIVLPNIRSPHDARLVAEAIVQEERRGAFRASRGRV